MIPAAAVALGLAALLRPHLAVLALAIVAPIARALKGQPHEIEMLAAAAIGGALIAAARPRLTPLGAGRPGLVVPVVLFAGAAVRVAGVTDAAPLLAGMAAAYVAARHARDGVSRPIHLIRAALAGGIIAVAFRPEPAGLGGAGVTFPLVAGVLGLGSLIWMLAAFLIRVARGFNAYPADRVLMGAVAAIASFVALLVREPTFVLELMIPFWILIGATLARADGDAFKT